MFYEIRQNLISSAMNLVKNILKLYPKFQVKVANLETF